MRQSFKKVYSSFLWKLLLFGTISVSAIIIPNHLVMPIQKSGIDWQLDIIIAVVFFLDFLLRIPDYRHPPKRERNKQLRYFWLTVDLLATIPWRWIFGSSLLDILRLFKLFRIQEIFREETHRHLFINIFIQLVSFTYWVLLWVHWLACGWIFLSNGQDPYLRSLYWAVTTLTTVGYGDVTPVTTAQTIYTMIVMLLGVGVYGYIIGNVTTLLNRMDMSKAIYQNKLHRLHNFLHYRRVPVELQGKIFNYYDYLFDNRMGFDEAALLSDLPESLQNELSLSLKRKLLSRVPYFQQASEEFIQELSKRLKPIIVMPNDIIFKEGDIGKDMFFIGRGSISIFKNERHEPLATLHDGNFLGELSLIHALPRNASARALEYCDLYSLAKKDFDDILELFPKFANHIHTIAQNRTEIDLKI